MTNVIEFKKRTPVNESDMAAFSKLSIGAIAMLMDVRTQLNCIGSSLPSLEDATTEIWLDRLISITKDMFEKIIIPLEVPVAVSVRHERDDMKAQSILISGFDLECCKQAAEGNDKVPPSFRLEVSYQELEEGDKFQRIIASEPFDELVNSVNNQVPKSILLTLFDRMVSMAKINNGATIMTENKKMYVAYIPHTPKYTIVIALQGDLSEV